MSSILKIFAPKEKRSAELLTSRQEKLREAERQLELAEAACVDDPTDVAFEAVKTARVARNEARSEFEIAKKHRERLDAERAAALREEAEREYERIASNLPPLVGQNEAEMAAEIAYVLHKLVAQVATSIDRRMSATKKLDELSRQLGRHDRHGIRKEEFEYRAWSEVSRILGAASKQLGTKRSSVVATHLPIFGDSAFSGSVTTGDEARAREALATLARR